MTTHIIRGILSLALVYGVYTETGVWTALAVFLLIVGQEMQTIYTKLVYKSLR